MPFSHDLTLLKEAPKSNGICFDFINGKCQRGAACRFSRDLGAQAQANASKSSGICFDHEGPVPAGAACCTMYVPTYTPTGSGSGSSQQAQQQSQQSQQQSQQSQQQASAPSAPPPPVPSAAAGELRGGRGCTAELRGRRGAPHGNPTRKLRRGCGGGRREGRAHAGACASSGAGPSAAGRPAAAAPAPAPTAAPRPHRCRPPLPLQPPRRPRLCPRPCQCPHKRSQSQRSPRHSPPVRLGTRRRAVRSLPRRRRCRPGQILLLLRVGSHRSSPQSPETLKGQLARPLPARRAALPVGNGVALLTPGAGAWIGAATAAPASSPIWRRKCTKCSSNRRRSSSTCSNRQGSSRCSSRRSCSSSSSSRQCCSSAQAGAHSGTPSACCSGRAGRAVRGRPHALRPVWHA